MKPNVTNTSSPMTLLPLPEGAAEIGEDAFYGRADLKRVQIPDGVVRIGDHAFMRCPDLEEIHLPDSVKEIGQGVFYHCEKLKTIHIPDSVTEIKPSTFTGCHELKHIDLPGSITKIGDGAFFASGLEEIYLPDGVTEIERNAFDTCLALREIHIPASVAEIGGFAFVFCPELEHITVSPSNERYDSRSGCNAIIETQTDTLIVGCKSTTIPDSVTKLGECPFYGNSTPKEIFIPGHLTEIGGNAFDSCPGIESIKVSPSNKRYDSRAGCNAIIETKTHTLLFGCKNTTIPAGVIRIGDCAFRDCSDLTEVVIPDGVTQIGSLAFSQSGLKKIHLPEKIYKTLFKKHNLN